MHAFPAPNLHCFHHCLQVTFPLANLLLRPPQDAVQYQAVATDASAENASAPESPAATPHPRPAVDTRASHSSQLLYSTALTAAPEHPAERLAAHAAALQPQDKDAGARPPATITTITLPPPPPVSSARPQSVLRKGTACHSSAASVPQLVEDEQQAALCRSSQEGGDRAGSDSHGWLQRSSEHQVLFPAQSQPSPSWLQSTLTEGFSKLPALEHPPQQQVSNHAHSMHSRPSTHQLQGQHQLQHGAVEASSSALLPPGPLWGMRPWGGMSVMLQEDPQGMHTAGCVDVADNLSGSRVKPHSQLLFAPYKTATSVAAAAAAQPASLLPLAHPGRGSGGDVELGLELQPMAQGRNTGGLRWSGG